MRRNNRRNGFFLRDNERLKKNNNQFDFEVAKKDGITFETIDLTTMKKIQTNTWGVNPPKIKEEERQVEVEKEVEKNQLLDKSHVNILKEILQNELNGENYYKMLLEKCEDFEDRLILQEIIKNCNDRALKCRDFLYKKNNEKLEEKKLDLNLNFDYVKGVKNAIIEENKSMKKIMEFYDNVSDLDTLKYLNSLIYNKLTDINLLRYLY